MNDIQFKELIELHIKNRLNELVNEPCFENFKGKYVIQDNKYNIPANSNTEIYNISDIDIEIIL